MRSMIIPGAILFLLLAAGASAAQQSGVGLRVFEAEQEGICRDEALPDTGGQAALLGEMRVMLVRMRELQQTMARGVSPREGRQIEGELGRMRERTDQMIRELERTSPGR